MPASLRLGSSTATAAQVTAVPARPASASLEAVEILCDSRDDNRDALECLSSTHTSLSEVVMLPPPVTPVTSRGSGSLSEPGTNPAAAPTTTTPPPPLPSHRTQQATYEKHVTQGDSGGGGADVRGVVSTPGSSGARPALNPAVYSSSPPAPRSILTSGRYTERRSSADTYSSSSPCGVDPSVCTSRGSMSSPGQSPNAAVAVRDRGGVAALQQQQQQQKPLPLPGHECDTSYKRVSERYNKWLAGLPPIHGAGAAGGSAGGAPQFLRVLDDSGSAAAAGGWGGGASAGGQSTPPMPPRRQRSAPGVRGLANLRCGDDESVGPSLHPSFLGLSDGGDVSSVRSVAGRCVPVQGLPSREPPSATASPPMASTGVAAEHARLLPHPSSAADLRAPIRVATQGAARSSDPVAAGSAAGAAPTVNTATASAGSPSSSSLLASSNKSPSAPGDASPEDLYLTMTYGDMMQPLPYALMTASPDPANTTMPLLASPARNAAATPTATELLVSTPVSTPPQPSTGTTPLTAPAADGAAGKPSGEATLGTVVRNGTKVEPAGASLPLLPAAASPLAPGSTKAWQPFDASSTGSSDDDGGGGTVSDSEGVTSAAPSTMAHPAIHRMNSVDNLHNYSSFLLCGRHAGSTSSAASISSTATTAGFSGVAPSKPVVTREVDAAGAGSRRVRSGQTYSSDASDTTRCTSISGFSFAGTPAAAAARQTRLDDAASAPTASILTQRHTRLSSASRRSAAPPTPSSVPSSKPTQSSARPVIPLDFFDGPLAPPATPHTPPAKTVTTPGSRREHDAGASVVSLAASSEADWAPGSVMQAVSEAGDDGERRRGDDDVGTTAGAASTSSTSLPSTTKVKSGYSGLWLAGSPSSSSRSSSSSSTSSSSSSSDGSWELNSTRAQHGGVQPAQKVTSITPAAATPPPQRRARRLLPMDSFRSYYIAEAFLGEDRTCATYKVRERRTQTRYAATFVLHDGSSASSTSPALGADARHACVGSTPSSESSVQPSMSTKLKRRCAMALLIDHPNLVPTYDVFYGRDEDAADVEEIVRCCTGAGGAAAVTWGPERYTPDHGLTRRPRVAVQLSATPALTPVGVGSSGNVAQRHAHPPHGTTGGGATDAVLPGAEVQPPQPQRSRSAPRAVRRWLAGLLSSLSTLSPSTTPKDQAGEKKGAGVGSGGVELEEPRRHRSGGSAACGNVDGLDAGTAARPRHTRNGDKSDAMGRDEDAGAGGGFQFPAEISAMIASRERRVAELRGRRTQKDRETAARHASKLEWLAAQLLCGRVTAILVSELVESGSTGLRHETDARLAMTLLERSQAWGGLPSPLVASIARGVAAALDYLHTFRMPHLALIHGYVDPHNIVVDSRGVVRLVNYNELHWWLRYDHAAAGQQAHRQRTSVTSGEDAAASAGARRRLRVLEGWPHASILQESAADMYGLGCSLLTLSSGLPLGKARQMMHGGQFPFDSDEKRHLLRGLLEERPAMRLTAAGVLRHAFVTGASAEAGSVDPPPLHHQQEQQQRRGSSRVRASKLPVLRLPRTAAVPVSTKTTTTSTPHAQSAPRSPSPVDPDAYSLLN